MAFCSNCGSPVNDDSATCENCGAVLLRSQPVQPEQPIQPTQPVQPEQPIQPTQPVQPVQPVQPINYVQPVQPVQQVMYTQPGMYSQPVQAGWQQPVAEEQPGSGKLRVGMLVWSIIFLVVDLIVVFWEPVFGLLFIAPFGIIALLMTILASKAKTARVERGMLKVARVMNILNTIFGSIFFIVAIEDVLTFITDGMDPNYYDM